MSHLGNDGRCGVSRSIIKCGEPTEMDESYHENVMNSLDDPNASIMVYDDTRVYYNRISQNFLHGPLALPAPSLSLCGVKNTSLHSEVSCPSTAQSAPPPSSSSAGGGGGTAPPLNFSRSNSNYQIVLFRDRSMVVYDSNTRYLCSCAITPDRESVFRLLQLTQCPMCGQIVDPCKFSFEAQSYFRLLQNMWISHVHFSDVHGRSFDHSTPSLCNQSCPPALSNDDDDEATGNSNFVESDKAMNPFVTDELRRNGDIDGKHFYENESVLTGMCITGYYSSFFQEIRSLGSGSYGQVFLCHHYLDEVFIGEYAVKKVPVGQDRRWLQSMLREVKIREKLHHRNVVDYKHSWLEMHRTSSHLPLIPWLFVLMEYCNAGDLDDFLTQNNYVYHDYRGEVTSCRGQQPFLYLKECFIWKFFLDIANGLNHLHHSGILHRDLKPQNILLQCTLNNLSQRTEVTALLSDFGTSELLSDKVPERHGFTGTIEYTAPELLEIDEKGCFRQDYDEKSDIWSLGIILYAMAFGHVPYFDRDPQKCRVKILNHTDPQLIIPSNANRSNDFILLIEALLQRNPRLRPSLDTILQHPRIRRRLTDTTEKSDVEMQLYYIISQRWNTENRTSSSDVISPLHSKIQLPSISPSS